MQQRNSILWFVLLSLVCLVAFAQSRPYTPPPGDPERQAIMDALRTPVERDLRKRVLFKVDRLKVQEGWAFMRGTPLRPDGRAMDYHDTPYQQAIDADSFEDWICALLYWRNGQWQVAQYMIGATDKTYEGWDRQFGAPLLIFR